MCFASEWEGEVPSENTCFSQLGIALVEGSDMSTGKKSCTKSGQDHHCTLETRLWIPTQLGPGPEALLLAWLDQWCLHPQGEPSASA